VPKGTRRHPKDEHDWKFFHTGVVKEIRRFHDDGYKIVWFTNQKGP
jgi:bifunctional polynucleotide phosphatase/kinase